MQWNRCINTGHSYNCSSFCFGKLNVSYWHFLGVYFILFAGLLYQRWINNLVISAVFLFFSRQWLMFAMMMFFVAVKENGGHANKIAPVKTWLIFDVYKLTKVLSLIPKYPQYILDVCSLLIWNYPNRTVTRLKIDLYCMFWKIWLDNFLCHVGITKQLLSRR